MVKKYYLIDDSQEYSFDDINQKILNGKLVKDSFIWDKSLPDWIKVKDHHDFTPVFQEIERMAENRVKKALGTDDESIEKREMQELIGELHEHDDDIVIGEKQPFPWKKIVVIVVMFSFLSALIASIVLSPDKPTAVAKKEVEAIRVDDLNLNEMRFTSGIKKIDKYKPIEGMKIKKITRRKEKKMIAEAIIEEKIEKGEIKVEEIEKVKAKKSSIFDQVSDNEIENFRKKLLSISTVRSKNVKVKKGGFFKQKEELSSKQVAATVRQYSAGTVKYCYNKSLKVDASVSGKMEVTLHILGNGNVSKVVTNTDKFKGTNMSRCVSKLVKKRWKFPPFKGTVMEVTLPFVLTSN